MAKYSLRRKMVFGSVLIVMVLAFLIVGVIFVEIYSGYAYYKFKDSLRAEINAIRLRENYHSNESVVIDNAYRTDSSGYILPYTFDKNNPNTVVFVGGSTTACQEAKEETRIHVLLREFLLVRDGIEVNNINAGHSGNHSVHSMNLLVNKLLQHKPRVVVINNNINDLSTLLHTGTYFNDSKSRSLLLKDTEQMFDYRIRFPKNKWVRKYIPYTSVIMLPTLFEGEDDSTLFESYAKQFVPVDSVAIFHEYKSSMTAIVRLCESWGAKPVICT